MACKVVRRENTTNSNSNRYFVQNARNKNQGCVSEEVGVLTFGGPPKLKAPRIFSNSYHGRSDSSAKNKRKYVPILLSDDDSEEEAKRFKFEEESRPTLGQQRQQSLDYGQSLAECSVARKTTSNTVVRMMKSMGYEEGKSLEKHSQGRVEPVQPAKQYTHRGLGLHLPGLEDASSRWDPESEEVRVREDIKWIANDDREMLMVKVLKKWIKMGANTERIDNETAFCNPNTVRDVVKWKTVIDGLSKVEMLDAIKRSNPFETIHSAFFLNRAAVKMANIDRACDFMFTKPKNLSSNELLYFADVCAGPGGFSEYVLWRKKWRAKGFGFTLKNENDFKLDDFYAGPCETFHPFYGPKENGDVFDPDNQDAFHKMIMKQTNGIGVHFMMADGGFSVEGRKNIQEILSKQLYLCQCLIALRVVRVGGHFVTKLFDLFTPFSAGLVYLMYRCFDQVSIFKPNASRPANSERYLICKGKRPYTQDVVTYLDHINKLLLRGNKKSDVIEIVSMEEMEAEGQFLHYLKESNDYLGRKQITGLLKVAAYCQDTTLCEARQATMRKQCMQYWRVPEKTRVAPNRGEPQERLKALTKSLDYLDLDPQRLTPRNIDKTVMKLPYDWFCVPCTTSQHIDNDRKPALYMGMGRSRVYRYNEGTWVLMKDLKIVLPPDTLIYAEVVTEMWKEGKSQRRKHALHIIDAYFLGGQDISMEYIQVRHELIDLFCRALWKPNAGEYVRIRAKDLYSMDGKLEEKLRVTPRLMKVGDMALTYEFKQTSLDDDDDDDEDDNASRNVRHPLYFALNSVMFLKSTRCPWSRHYSRTHSRTYVFNCINGSRFFETERPKEAEATFIDSFKSRLIWHWPNDRMLPMEVITQKIKEVCPYSCTW